MFWLFPLLCRSFSVWYSLTHLVLLPVLGMDLFESESEVAQWCLTLCNSMECSPPGFSVRGVFQARILEWVAISFSRGSSPTRDQTQVSCTAGRCFTLWATRKVLCCLCLVWIYLSSSYLGVNLFGCLYSYLSTNLVSFQLLFFQIISLSLSFF